MKVTAHPLVVAAALGLLGPAALAGDEFEASNGVAGVWTRVESQAPTGPAPLGDTIEVIPFEDRVLLDDGLDQDGAMGTWSLVGTGLAQQELIVGTRRVVRKFEADGDRLHVRTTVDDATVFTDVFTRVLS